MTEQTTEKIYSFGEFEVDAEKRRLMKDGQAIRLKSKAFDLLLTLIERRGEILSKNDLMDLLWANQFVEENNLTVHVAALRKALGEKKDEHRFIVTVPGQGYKFIGDLNGANGNGNFTLETHTLSRITIEEASNENALKKAKASQSTFKKWQIAAACLILFSLLSVVGYYIWRNTRKANAAFQIASVKRLTTVGKVGNVAALSPDGKLFAYSLLEKERQSLWLGHVDGGEPIQILQPVEAVFLSLKFAPDGSSLYYTQSADRGNGSLYRLPVFGGAAEKIKDNVRNAIAFAPDGKRFAFVRIDRNANKSALVVASLDNADEREIVSALPNKFDAARHTPTWSPDGATIALGAASDDSDSSYEIMTIDAADGTAKNLTAHGWSEIDGATWRGDGIGLIVVACDKNSFVQQLFQVAYPSGDVSRIVTDLSIYGYSISASADTNELLTVQSQIQSNIFVAPVEDLSAARQITFDSIGRQDGWYGVNWMPNEKIIYAAIVDKTRTIWTMDADGKNQKQLIPSGSDSLNPSVSSDGRVVVFESNRGGKYAIWRADADGGNLVQLTANGFAAQPAVSPDGKWVVYNSGTDDFGTLNLISTDGGEPRRLTEKLAGWASFSPDGKFVACAYSDNGKIKLAVFSIENSEPVKSFDVPRTANFRFGVRWLADGKAVTYRDWANGIWLQSLDADAPKRLEGLPQEKLYAFDWSPDGKFLAYTRGSETRDLVLINNAR